MSVVNQVSIPTARGTVVLERYDDGDVLLGLCGNGWVGLSPTDISALNQFFASLSPMGTAAPLTKPVPSAQVVPGFQKEVKLEPGGWGVTVAEGVRYIYVSRNKARVANLSHCVGTHGRIK